MEGEPAVVDARSDTQQLGTLAEFDAATQKEREEEDGSRDLMAEAGDRRLWAGGIELWWRQQERRRRQGRMTVSLAALTDEWARLGPADGEQSAKNK